MKRVRVAPGRFVNISAELAEKAASVFGSGLTRIQIRDFEALERDHFAALMAGSPKPLAIVRTRPSSSQKINDKPPTPSTTVANIPRSKAG
ncbi:hypothetical protein [Roseateles sp. P5_D6]